MARYKSRSKESGAFFRSFKALMSVVVLTAFVLGISYFVKQASTADISTILSFAEPVMSKVGISTQEAGVVAGEFAKRVNETKIDSSIPGSNKVSSKENSKPDSSIDSDKEVLFQVCILSDSHDENNMLKEAVSVCEEKGIDTLFHLGDLTNHGEVESLTSAKEVLDSEGLEFYVLPGDHDLYAAVGPDNFIKVFGEPNRTVTIDDTKFVLFDNSPNYTPVDTEQMSWLKKQLVDADFLLLSQPLYHPSGDRVMGMITGEKDQGVYDSGQEMLKYVREAEIKGIIAGDRHELSLDRDPEKPELLHYAAGALTTSKNLDLKSQFSIMSIYTDSSFGFDEVVLE